MEQSNIKNKEMIFLNQNAMPVDVRANGRQIIIEHNQEVSDQAIYALQNQLKEYTEIMSLKLEQNTDEIKDVKRTIKSKYISPQDLDALKTLIHKKAEMMIEKQKGVQLSVSMFLNTDQEALKAYKAIYNNERGKLKSRIWVELNKECLERKGNAPKNRILDKHVEKAFDFVRKWGGFTV